MGWRSRAGWAALFVFLSGGPALLAAAFAPAGFRFLGGLASPDDTSAYLAAMYQGSRGAWLYRSPFDPTSTPPLLMYLTYLTSGHLARLLALDLTVAYHLTRLACGVLVLAVAACWSAALLGGHKGRLSAWILVVFSSGIGWLLALIPMPAWQAHLIDLRLPEASTFLSVFTAPHFALGVALEGLALLAFWKATQGPRWLGWAAWSGLSLLGLGLNYAFTLPVVYGTMAGYVLWVWWRGGYRRGWYALRAALVGGGVAAPFVLYYMQAFFFDPFWKGTHVTQNVIATPGLGWLLAGYGLPLAMAVWGGIQGFRERGGLGSLVSLWAAINGLALFLPLTFRWRMANGWHFALALLAARGLEEGIIPWLSRQREADAETSPGIHLASPSSRWNAARLNTFRRMILILAMPSTWMVSLIGVRIALTERGFPYYLSQEELRAMDGLAQQVSYDDVVLGAYQTGNVLPTRALCRVVVGQQFATLDPLAKLADVARFFDAQASDQERRAILERYGVTVVYYGPWERAIGPFNPGDSADMREIYRSGEVVAFRVQYDAAH